MEYSSSQMKESFSCFETLNFRITKFSNPSGDGIIIGNSGLHFLGEGGDWTWHYQPDGNSGPVVGKGREYATVFLGAFGEFMRYWHRSNFSEGNKPDLIESLTNPMMANFLTREFKGNLVKSRSNFCDITFNLPLIDGDQILLTKFILARKRCRWEKYQMLAM